MEAFLFAQGDPLEKDDPDQEDVYPPQPDELTILQYIDRFGVEAVMGRPILSAGEIYRMIFAENVVFAYRDRKASKNWAAWAESNPSNDALLKKIEMDIANAPRS